MASIDNHNKAYTNLDYVAKSYLIEQGDFTMHNYGRVLDIAIRGYDQLNMTSLNTVKVVNLVIKDNLTVDLPDDFLHYTKIGVNINGLFVTLGLNRDIVIPKVEDLCGVNIAAATQAASQTSTDLFSTGYYYNPQFRNGQYVGEQYSAGGGFSRYGYYRVDYDKKLIAFDSVVPKTTIILEYKSRDIECNGEVLIPRQAVEPLVEWIYYRVTKANPRSSPHKIQTAKMDWFLQTQEMRHYESSKTMSEYLDNSYGEYKATAKR